MSLPAVAAGLGGVALLALGSNFILPVGELVGGVCDIAGIVAAMVCFGLAEGA